MSDTIWHKEECGPGREYMLARDLHIKYDDQEGITQQIKEGLGKFIKSEPSVRINIDSPLSNSERVILAIPLASDQDQILENFARILYQTLMGYYYNAEPKSSHFGIANLLIEGNLNSLLRRELERMFHQFHTRADMAGRLLNNVKLIMKNPVPEIGKSFLADTIQDGMDIHVGYRIHALGENINHAQIFLPMEGGADIINQIYYNLEQILHHNFVSYDEAGEGYLKVTETLIFKDLEEILKRAKVKENTRKKVLNNIQFNTIFTKDPHLEHGIPLGDDFYDQLNKIQDEKLVEVTKKSHVLFASYLLKTSEIAQDLQKKGFTNWKPDEESSAALPSDKEETEPAKAKTEDSSVETVKAKAKKDDKGIRVPAPEEAAKAKKGSAKKTEEKKELKVMKEKPQEL